MDAYFRLFLTLITLMMHFISVLVPEDAISISIPALNIQSPIREFHLNGTSWDIDRWERGVGHLQGTAWFDAPGNIALGGHSEMPDLSRGIFAELDQLEIGDLIVIHFGLEERHYAVTSITNVAQDDLTPLYPTSSERLTLITCDTLTYNRRIHAYAKRVVVIAERLQ